MKPCTKSPEALAKLNPEQFRFTQRNGTRSPCAGEQLDHHAPGICVDIASGEPLFDLQAEGYDEYLNQVEEI